MLAHTAEKGKVRDLRKMWMLPLAPFIGLAYFLSLPFIAVGMVLIVMGKRLYGGTLSIARDLVFFEWRPAETYLSGKKKSKKTNNKEV